jgi:epsilon-lactone hydrolase
MPSAAAETMIATYREYQLAPDAPGRTWQDLRVISAQLAEAQPPATGVDISVGEAGGVPVERTRVEGATPVRHVVYVHGGGYVCGSAGGQRAFLAALARAAEAEVHAVEYRLAPEHACPAAVDDVVAATVAVQSTAGDQPVIVGGDSAGGGLAVAAVLEMRERGLALPSAVFALSPWADMTLDGASIEAFGERDIMVRRNDLQMMRECYLGGGDPSGRHASPGLAVLSGLPPLLVQVGGEEVLVGDARLLAERAAAHGVLTELEIAAGMFHTFQVLSPDLPESQEAIASLARFLKGA